MNEAQKYPYAINGNEAFSSDRTPTPGQLLADAGFEPPDDFLLIKRTSHGARALSSDETVDLGDGTTELYAFQGGIAYQLTINQHTLLWGRDRIEIELLRRIGRVPDDHDLVWTREDGNGDVLAKTGIFVLSGKGTEHLTTRLHHHEPAVYVYFVGDREYTTEHESLTGAQIIARIPDWNSVNTLVLESEGAEPDEPIHATTVVVFKGRTTPARFVITPPATFGFR